MDPHLEKFCAMCYASHYIPVTVFQNGIQTAFYGAIDVPLNMTAILAAASEESAGQPVLFAHPDLGQYALLRREGDAMLIGPVFSTPVGDQVISAFARRTFVPSADMPALTAFLQGIPLYSYNQFANLIVFFHYSLTGEMIDLLSLYGTQAPSAEDISVRQVREEAQQEQGAIHGTWQFENTLLSYVRNGEVEKMRSFLLDIAAVTEFREGVLADTPLRQAKNLFIGLVCMVGKIGAIGGGMNVEEAYRLIDLYTQECEKTASLDAIKTMQFHMVMDFTERVARERIPMSTSREIYTAMQYIQNHTNQPISLNDVADHISKSRPWLTKRFREETGFTVGEFITRCRLRDAKRLLRYSDQSLSDISNYLCFSSQAYFQTVFKRANGMTPGKYRMKQQAAFSEK